MVTRALATAAGVGVGAGAAKVGLADNEPPDKGIARMQAQADAMVVNSGVPPRTTAVDFTAPRGS